MQIVIVMRELAMEFMAMVDKLYSTADPCNFQVSPNKKADCSCLSFLVQATNTQIMVTNVFKIVAS